MSNSKAIASILFAWTAIAAAQPAPTPGPAARAGAAVDRVLVAARDEVATALLLARLRVALLEGLGTDGLRVQIGVNGDQVVLAGEVVERANVERAGELARAVPGVREVHNRLRAANGRPADEPPVARVVGKAEREVADAILQAKVKARLLDQLGRVGFSIDVEAKDGAVVLSGTVPDAERRRLAANIAGRTPGVSSVRTLLKTAS